MTAGIGKARAMAAAFGYAGIALALSGAAAAQGIDKMHAEIAERAETSMTDLWAVAGVAYLLTAVVALIKWINWKAVAAKCAALWRARRASTGKTVVGGQRQPTVRRARW